MSNKFNVGDFCFCDYKLVQVLRKNEDAIIEVTDGFSFKSAFELNSRCFPIEISIMKISAEVMLWHNRFSQLWQYVLNTDGIEKKLVSIWIEMCLNKDNNEKLSQQYTILESFGREATQRVEELKNISVQDVMIFKR